MAKRRFDGADKASVTVAPSIDHELAVMQRHVATSARAAFSQGVRRPPNYAELLSTVWEMAQELIESVRLSEAPLTHKVAMLRDLTKLLPALDKAESRHRVHIGKRVVQDMTSQDLEAAVKQIFAKKAQHLGKGDR